MTRPGVDVVLDSRNHVVKSGNELEPPTTDNPLKEPLARSLLGFTRRLFFVGLQSRRHRDTRRSSPGSFHSRNARVKGGDETFCSEALKSRSTINQTCVYPTISTV